MKCIFSEGLVNKKTIYISYNKLIFIQHHTTTQQHTTTTQQHTTTTQQHTTTKTKHTATNVS